MNISDIIIEARMACEGVFEEEWHDAVEDKIIELSESPEQADDAIMQLNTQLFRACGLI